MKSKSQKVSNRDLAGMIGALGALGNRALPSMDSDIKVGRITNHMAPICDPIGPGKKKRMAAFGETHNLEDLTDIQAQVLTAQLAVELDVYDAHLVDVEIPDIKITRNDLPKEKTGDDGWKNGAGLGAIISDLGILFEYPEEPKDESKKKE